MTLAEPAHTKAFPFVDFRGLELNYPNYQSTVDLHKQKLLIKNQLDCDTVPLCIANAQPSLVEPSAAASSRVHCLATATNTHAATHTYRRTHIHTGTCNCC